MNDYTFEFIENELQNTLLKRTDADGNVTWIPLDERNSDYQAYLASLDGSIVEPVTPEAVDESEPTELADEPSSDTE
jgi:ATP/maltotriose-dependent transcriptional regulator MalT